MQFSPEDTMPILAPIAGATASAVANRTDDRFARRTMDWLSGSLFGLFGGPCASDVAGVASEHGRLAVSFLMGLVGAMLANKITAWFQAASLQDLVAKIFRVNKLIAPIAALLLLVASAIAADPPIRFPIDPPAPPVPTPMPAVVNRLGLDQVYVIDSDIDLIVITRPAGVVSVTTATGPVTIRDSFAGGSGMKKQVKTFAGKFIYLVDPIAPGATELLVLPVGGKQADVITKSITVGDPPAPVPPAPADALSATLQTAFTAEASATKLTDAKALASIYRVAAARGGTIDDVDFATAGDMLKTIATAAQSMVPASRLAGVREQLAKELDSKVGTDPSAKLTNDSREQLRSQFTRFAALLDSLK